MKLYIVRHGRAASSAVDPQRALTQQGRAEVRKLADFIRRLDISVDSVWHSGKLRAAQTAEILAAAMTVKDPLTAHPGLAPNDHPSPILAELIPADRDTMIVAHLPFVARLASLLLVGSDTHYPISFREATTACLEQPSNNHWQIEWLIGPESLSRE